MTSAKHKRDLKYSNDFSWEKAEDVLQEEMEAKPQKDQKNRPETNGLGEVFYGRKLDWYKEVALWPMFILLIIELGVKVVQTKYLFLWNEQIFLYIIYGARVVLFSYLAISAIKFYRATKAQALFAAASGGFVVGFLLAIFQLFWYFELWAFFNLIRQPLLMMFLGLAIAWVIFTSFKKLIK